MNNRCHAKTFGFTLAEVLITLGIIGIIAALTIPSLIQKQQEKETVVKLKKFYSVMSQAQLMAIATDGSVSDWDLEFSSKKGATDLYLKFKPYLKVVKECGFEDKGCFTSEQYKLSNGDVYGSFVNGIINRYMVLLADGSSVAFLSSDCIRSCGAIYIDVNGVKPPNQFGVDLFQISIDKKRLIPYILADMDVSLIDNCIKKGYACSEWVLRNENMNYLKCPDELLADTNLTKCK